ncbi:MAG: MFS transporter [Bacteroidia bacterium]|nr:MFS transporter [Bacteroidia bacterium]
MEKNKTRGIMPLLFVGVLMGALDISIVGPAIPSIEKLLKISTQYSSWIFSIYVLFNLVGISLFARLSDIYGRRKIYIISILIFASGSLVVAITNTYDYLLLGRAIQGFGVSGIFPVASAVIGDLYPKEKRGQLLGLLGAVFGIAFMIGPLMAGIILNYFSWNVLFLINLPISAGLVYYSAKLLPNYIVSNSAKIDWKGIIFLGLFLAGFTFSINNLRLGEASGFEDKWIVMASILSLVSLILLLITERRNPNPIIKLGFFKNPTILITGIIAMVSGLVQACFVFIPKYSVLTLLIPFVLATAVGSPIFGKLIDKYGVKPILIIGIVLNLIGFSILTLSGNSILLYYTSGVFIGLGLSVLAGSSVRYIMLNVTKPEDRATSQGMLTIFTSSGQLIGSAVFGLILGSVVTINPFKYVFLTASLALFVVLFLAFMLRFSKNE